MGACHSEKKKKKSNFAINSRIDNKLAAILEKEYSQDQYFSHHNDFMQNLHDITQNRIEDSLDLSQVQERSCSVMKPVGKSPRLKKPRIKRKKQTEETKTSQPENVEENNPKQKVIKLKKPPHVTKKKSRLPKVEDIEDEKESPNLKNGNYYELLDNLDKSRNLVSQNLDSETLNEEFKQLKEFVDKKLELLNKKEYQLNLIKNGLENHFQKETSTDLEMNILTKKLNKKIKKLNSKTDNLSHLHDQLYKFMSNTQSQANVMNKEGIQKTLDQITQPDPEIYQFQRTLTRRNSGTAAGMVSPSISYLKKNMLKKKPSLCSPSPLFLQKQNSHQPSPMLLRDMREGINSGMLRSKVEKKLEQVDMDTQMLEFLTARLKKGSNGDQEQIKDLITEVGGKIIGKLKKVHLDELEKEGQLDSEGVVVWSDTDEPNLG